MNPLWTQVKNFPLIYSVLQETVHHVRELVNSNGPSSTIPVLNVSSPGREISLGDLSV